LYPGVDAYPELLLIRVFRPRDLLFSFPFRKGVWGMWEFFFPLMAFPFLRFLSFYRSHDIPAPAPLQLPARYPPLSCFFSLIKGGELADYPLHQARGTSSPFLLISFLTGHAPIPSPPPPFRAGYASSPLMLTLTFYPRGQDLSLLKQHSPPSSSFLQAMSSSSQGPLPE